MADLREVLERNREWAESMAAQDPGFFERLSSIQNPSILWIGCSDSRVPANQITGHQPGEVFVHRNVANVVVPSDLNCLSTIQYAVDQLKVEHLMVVGHYGCGGVLAALEDVRVGLADNWIRHVKDVRDKHQALLASLSPQWRHDALCELNAIEQVINVAQSTVMQDAWARGQKVSIHGWTFGVNDGLLNDLKMTVDSTDAIESLYHAAIDSVVAARRA
jgi:carbonic anhydrase